MRFKEDVGIATDDFWYDLFEGGYIDPEKLLKREEDVAVVRDAIRTLEKFRDDAEKHGVVELI